MNTLTTQQIHAFIGPVVVMAERDHHDALFTAIANGQALLARFYAIELVRIERALHLIYHSHSAEPFPGDPEPEILLEEVERAGVLRIFRLGGQ